MDHSIGDDPHNHNLADLPRIDPQRVARLQEKYSVDDSLEDEYNVIKQKIYDLQVRWQALQFLED